MCSMAKPRAALNRHVELLRFSIHLMNGTECE